MIEVLGVTNTELGILNSVFGVFAVICYAPGGWLADRVSPNLLLAISLIGTGLAGIYFSTLPSYTGIMVVHAIWGITTILTFWAAFIKATRETGSEKDQAKVFGFVEGGRGLFEAVLGSFTVGLFASFTSQAIGLKWVIFFYSILCVLIGFLVWVALPKQIQPNTGKNNHTKIDELNSWALIAEALRLKTVWLIAIIVLCGYSCYWGTFSLSYFATDGFGQTEVYGAALSNFRMWFRPMAAVLAGYLAMRIGVRKFLLVSFCVMTISYAMLSMMPTSTGTLWMLWGDTAVLAFLVFAIRAVYYALLQETSIPLRLTGTAVGFISVIGYLPDVFFPLLTGWLYDKYPGAYGHQYLFAGLVGLAIIGFVATWKVGRLYNGAKLTEG